MAICWRLQLSSISSNYNHNTPPICEDDVPIPDFGDGVLGDLIRCQSDPSVDKLVYLVDDACFRLFFGQRRGRLGNDVPQSLTKVAQQLSSSSQYIVSFTGLLSCVVNSVVRALSAPVIPTQRSFRLTAHRHVHVPVLPKGQSKRKSSTS